MGEMQGEAGGEAGSARLANARSGLGELRDRASDIKVRTLIL